MNREALARSVAYCGAVLLCAATIVRIRAEGPPYFTPPKTVLDHVWEGHHPQRDVLVVVPQLEPKIPRGATVTCFHPRNGAVWMDESTYLIAVGLMPYHDLLPPYAVDSAAAEYVIAVGGPLDHPRYGEVASVSGGWLYRRR